VRTLRGKKPIPGLSTWGKVRLTTCEQLPPQFPCHCSTSSPPHDLRLEDSILGDHINLLVAKSAYPPSRKRLQGKCLGGLLVAPQQFASKKLLSSLISIACHSLSLPLKPLHAPISSTPAPHAGLGFGMKAKDPAKPEISHLELTSPFLGPWVLGVSLAKRGKEMVSQMISKSQFGKLAVFLTSPDER